MGWPPFYGEMTCLFIVVVQLKETMFSILKHDTGMQLHMGIILIDMSTHHTYSYHVGKHSRQRHDY